MLDVTNPSVSGRFGLRTEDRLLTNLGEELAATADPSEAGSDQSTKSLRDSWMCSLG